MVRFPAVLLPVFLGIFLPGAACAGEGTTAAAYLGIDPSARSTAMGGASMAVGGDAFSFYHNPAGLASVRKDELALSHVAWFEGMHGEYLAYAIPLKGNITLTLGGSYFSSGDMDRLDEGGRSDGSYKYSAYSVGLSLARRVGDFSIGVTGKNVYESLDTDGSSALALDAGVSYLYRTLTVGAAVQNAGGQMAVASESFNMPRAYVFGAAWRPVDQLLVACDYYKPGESGLSGRVRGGAEYALPLGGAVQSASFRGGWDTGRDTGTGGGANLGMGVHFMRDYYFDYAYVPLGDLGTTHRISMRILFDGLGWDAMKPLGRPKRHLD